MTEPTLISQASAAVAKVSPPMVVTLYALVSKGLPFIISILTLTYLAIQLSHLVWVWRNEWVRKREIDQQMKGRVAGYTEKAPK